MAGAPKAKPSALVTMPSSDGGHSLVETRGARQARGHHLASSARNRQNPSRKREILFAIF